jgi:pimeloyl-ACP methyl ester carboxylesterase
VAAAAISLSAIELLASYLQARDDAVLLKYTRPPIPPHGQLTTIELDGAAMNRSVARSGLPTTAFARSFDMYAEAQIDGCDPAAGRNFVILSGTNGACSLYWDLVAHYRQQGYCTLVFDYRSHGRSEVAPGAYTVELFGEDSAAIIRKTFNGRAVHLLGWSLGGAVGYYLALEHPALVQSLAISGMTSCFGRLVTAAGDCDDSYLSSVVRPLSINGILPITRVPTMLKVQGTELLGFLASLPILFNHQVTDEVMIYHRLLRTEALTRTFPVWTRWDFKYYHDRIRTIEAPVLLMAGGLETTLGFGRAELEEDLRRLRNAEPEPVCRGTWARVTIDHFIHLALQTF